MKIWYLTHLPDSPSNALLEQAALNRGHDWLRIDPREVMLQLDSGGYHCMRAGQKLDWPETYFTRLGSSAPASCLNLLGLLEGRGISGMNRAEGIRIARDKAATATRLATDGIPHPRTAIVSSARDIEAAMEFIPGPPWILKLPVGTQGLGTVIAESSGSLRSMAELLLGREEAILVQEFIAEARSADLRVFIVAGEVRAAMRRQGKEGEFRSNLHRGGSAEAVKLDARTEETAIRAARSLGLEVAGIDILESHTGPLVLEVNAAPGLAGIETATGRDLAGAILERLAAL